MATDEMEQIIKMAGKMLTKEVKGKEIAFMVIMAKKEDSHTVSTVTSNVHDTEQQIELLSAAMGTVVRPDEHAHLELGDDS